MIPRPARILRCTQASSASPLSSRRAAPFLKPLRHFIDLRTHSSTTSAPSPAVRRPLKLAIIGSGPSGFYTASRILQSLPIDSPCGQGVEVHMYERLPTPYGLVRYGVAPDHPEVKNCQHKFDELALDPRFKFFGNVLISSQPSSSISSPSPSTTLSPYTYPHSLRLSLNDIIPYYTHLILTYGASLSNPLSSVPGSSSSSNPLAGVYPALALVSWYNSHPAFADLAVNLEGVGEVSVVGQGNVALDVARILLKPVEALAQTDLSEDVLNVLSKSSVKKVRVVGRRGPGQVAFTTKEFREMLALPGVRYEGVEKGLMEKAKEEVGNERMRKRLLGLMEKPSTSTSGGDGDKVFELDFLKSPKAFESNTHGGNVRVSSVEWNVNELLTTAPATPIPPRSQTSSVPTPSTSFSSSPQSVARPTGQVVSTPADMVVESVGYRSEPLGHNEEGWELPFDLARGRVRNVGGRVVDEQGVAIPGVYAAGWAARGPVGVIASTMHDAYSLSALILEDHYQTPLSTSSTAGPLPAEPEQGIPDALSNAKAHGKLVVDLASWYKIDNAEKERAKSAGKGKEREKFRRVEEMLAVLE